MMEANELIEPFERLLSDVVTSAAIRRIESGGPIDELWSTLQESGFIDALVPEDAGGAGLTLAQAHPLFHALGRHLVPLPMAQTMIARALMAQSGVTASSAPVVFVSPTQTLKGWRQNFVLLPKGAELLADLGDYLVLLRPTQYAIESAGIHASLATHVTWSHLPSDATRLPRPREGVRAIGAVLRACEIAGACDGLLRMTVEYAGQRVQFGKPIGRQQAIQQQLAVMAEQVVMARIAAQLGCAHGFPPPMGATAIAKQGTSAAVTSVTAIAHAVHGAIGISEEHDAQLFVRRLHEWRMAEGSESYWAAALGEQRFATDYNGSVDFLRRCLPAQPAAGQHLLKGAHS